MSMNRLAVSVLGLAASPLVFTTTPATAAYVIAGDLQSEQGAGQNDWSPDTSTLIMSSSGGIHSVTANNLLAGTAYQFKILDDGGSPPAAWGDPEITPNNVKIFGDADGSATITANDNVTNNQGKPVVWANFDGGVFQVVGDFMNEAGGAEDWKPDDASFRMTSNGGGFYSYNAVISTPGSYQFKITDGTGWNDNQVGTDGFVTNARTFQFSTTTPGQAVTLVADLAGGSISAVVPEPTSLALLGLASLGLVRRRRA